MLEYNYKDVYQSFSISYFTDDSNVLKNFVDIDELKDYEEIEKNRSSVLIKKFKLRVSVRENINFSNDIIVSENYMFDFVNLNHIDSLIKIAIVVDNIDNWIESGNLKDYDFVFTTNDDFLNSLKENHENVFIVKGESTYLKLKNILNLLYMRRKEKFYHFINSRFDNVFPKWNNYYKIFNSEFFDEKMYKEIYDVPDNTDPVFHYLVVGYKKYYNPGPNFSTNEYYMINPDVRKAGVNPLLHYEQYGRSENRKYHLSEEEKEERLSYIKYSPYFDEEWYVKTYDIPKDNVDPALHYLEIGFRERYNPGPDFNTEEYYSLNPDVKGADMNPLFHYEKYGRKEKRRVHSSD